MSQSTRIFGHMIATCSIGGTSYLLVCENVEITWDYDNKNATALKDTDEYPIGIRSKWSASGSFFISTANTSGEGGPGGTLWTKALAKAQVAVSVTDNAISGGANTLAGNAIITQIKQNIADGPQTCQITLTGQGALTSSIA